MTKHTRKLRWGAVGLLCLLVIVWAIYGLNFTQYITVWVGTMFKALSGGFIGWLVSRYVVELKLSEIDPNLRPLAALSQAIIIGAFALAVATGL